MRWDQQAVAPETTAKSITPWFCLWLFIRNG